MGVYFNRKRSFRQYLSLIKRYLLLILKFIPTVLTAYNRKLPDFLIIGVSKGGTTSLYEYLNMHPQVKVSREKEVNYFSKHYYRGISFYKSFFPYKKSASITGEATPYYFFHPNVPKRVKETLPNVKIILLLRDPVLRAYSQYQMIKGIDTAKNFEEAVMSEYKRVTEKESKLRNTKLISNSHQAYSYISRGLYFKQLSNWLTHFELNEILIIKSEDFFEEPQKTLKSVYGYLNLEEIYPSELKPINQREYLGITKDEYLKYKELFEEDSKKLINLLGEHYTW